MVDKVFIANMALGHIRAATISSFEEISINAGWVRTYYDAARQATLEAYDWSFARKRRKLALLTETAPDAWLYRYEYPANCIKARYIAKPGDRNPTDPITFEVELNDAGDAKTIVCDEPSAVLRYTIDVENPSLFPASFYIALSWRLAADLAIPCAGRPDDEARCLKMWGGLTDIAQTVDANEGQSDKEPDGEFITARA